VAVENKGQDQLRNNPVFVIGIACLLALIMIAVSVITYLRSDTRKTIEQIQTNNSHLKQDSSSLQKSGETTPQSITTTEKNITKDIQAHDDDTDFSPDELTDSALGL
jgi:ABC-type bacteriocin/lantibiotic exporter with double-glycine peptidase domain